MAVTRQLVRVRRLNRLLLAAVLLTLAVTLIIEVSARARYARADVGGIADRVHVEVMRIRREHQRRQHQLALDRASVRDYTDPLPPGSKGRFVWLNDLLVYVTPGGRVYHVRTPQ